MKKLTHAQSFEKAKAFLKNLFTTIGLIEVFNKSDLYPQRYYTCPIGDNSNKICFMFKSKEDCAKTKVPLAQSKIPFEIPPDKEYMIKIPIKSVLEASGIKSPTPKPVFQKDIPMIAIIKPDESEVLKGVSAVIANVNLDAIVQKIRKDPTFGFKTSTGRKPENNNKHTVYYFETNEQALLAKQEFSKTVENVEVRKTAVHIYMPIDVSKIIDTTIVGEPQEAEVVKTDGIETDQLKAEEQVVNQVQQQEPEPQPRTEEQVQEQSPEPVQAVEQTPPLILELEQPAPVVVNEEVLAATKLDEYFADFKKLLLAEVRLEVEVDIRSEIEMEMLVQFEQLSDQLKLAQDIIEANSVDIEKLREELNTTNTALVEIKSNNYIIDKNHSPIIEFPIEEIPNGGIVISTNVVIKKELLGIYCS